jgi:hypothetical protein
MKTIKDMNRRIINKTNEKEGIDKDLTLRTKFACT